MKKAFSILFLMFISYSFQGQTLVSINGGLNLATYHSGDQNGSFRGYPSYGVGIEVKGREPRPMHVGFAVEYLFSSVNWKSSQSMKGGTITVTRDLTINSQYLRLALFPELLIGKRFQFFCNLSPYFSFLIHGTAKETRENGKSITENASEEITKFDFGFQECIGFGYAVKSFLVLSIEERGCLGIMNIGKSAGSPHTAGLNIFFCLSFIIPKDPNGEGIIMK
jgi:hypothetical protein